MPRFDPNQRLGPGDGLGFLVSAEWWNGLLEHLRRATRLMADPATGLQVVTGTDATTIAPAGAFGDTWAKAGSDIAAASGTGGVQMTGGTVRLWFTDDAGLRTDSGIDAVAYNGSTSAVTAGNWLMVRRVGPLLVIIWEDC